MTDPEAVDILLVEDNPNDAELTQRALKKANLEARLTIARDGAEALDYLLSDRPKPKVIFLDLKLPKINGIEVLRRIKADPRTRSLPVTVLTGSDWTRDFEECKRLGAETYIVKPVDFQRLSQVTPQLRLCWSLVKQQSAQKTEPGKTSS